MNGKLNENSARELIDQLVQQGVTYFCSAPGFRSTPLALAAAEHPRAKLFVHFDERGLGFHALGYAKATGKPAALIVTSGTALGNLYPAVMEAALSHTPLIVLTADRPPELRDVHANQACDQIKFFGTYVQYQVDLPTPSDDLPNRFLATTVAQAVFCSKEGPVHINCAFREPFFGNSLELQTKTPCIYEKTETHASQESLTKWAALLNQHKKGAIIVGALRSLQEYTPLFELAETLGWPIMGDILSGLRSLGSQNSVVRYWDALIKQEENFQADLILHLGEQCVSKQLLNWKESIATLHVSLYADRCDPKHQVTHRMICDPLHFCAQILPYLNKQENGWLKNWKAREATLDEVVKDFFSKEETLSEPGIFNALPSSFPALFIANSMPIRDADRLFFPSEPTGPIFANRGLSGIDGNIATCAGIATSTPLIAILGDQTALHDLNSLAMLKKSPHPITLICINNGGGGIFSFVNIPSKKKIAEEVFAAAHTLTFEKAAELFDIPYSRVERKEELLPLLGKTHLIELVTTRLDNLSLHKELDQCLSSCMVS